MPKIGMVEYMRSCDEKLVRNVRQAQLKFNYAKSLQLCRAEVSVRPEIIQRDSSNFFWLCSPFMLSNHLKEMKVD